jgi:ParB family chromosome partitioning protein
VSKKLLAKASLIQLPPASSPAPAAEPGAAAPAPELLSEPRSRTAPGSMAHFLASQSSVAAEAEALRQQLKAFDGALPARALPAAAIRASRWANRHPASFEDAGFAELKADIAASGGNVQPVKVRPAVGPDGSEAYELVYGHRRHRACLELGLPVRAVIEPMDDALLFAQMERENRGRKSLSAWEQGMMYRRALDEGLFASQRKLSEALGVDVALVSKSLSLARLPDLVVRAFATPLDIQFRWAQPLAEAVQKDPDGVVGRAKALLAAGGPRPARDVLAALLGAPAGVLNGSTPAAEQPPSERQERYGKAGAGARLTVHRDGRVTVEADSGALSGEQLQALRGWLKAAFRR